jgi:energy-coupling factor transport system substrate-specific component
MDSGLIMLVVGVVLLAIAYVTMTHSLSSREIAAVASLGALSAAGRIAFAAIPSVQPSTVLVIVSGWVLGPSAGFTVGATTALVSNVFLGQGPWTIWQMLSWGGIGMVAGFLGRLDLAHPTRWIIAYSVAAGFAFGLAMDLWFWVSFIYPHTLASLLLTVATSLPFDLMHAAGNAVFAALFAARAVDLLQQFRSRMRVTYAEEVAHA